MKSKSHPNPIMLIAKAKSKAKAKAKSIFLIDASTLPICHEQQTWFLLKSKRIPLIYSQHHIITTLHCIQ